MLTHLKISGFKSLASVSIDFPRLTVLFGPNAVGKSNILDAIQALSRVGVDRTLSDALSEPIRGYPVEAFAFPPGGLSALLSQKRGEFSFEGDISVGRKGDLFKYRVAVEIQPASGTLGVADEYLAALGKKGDPKGNPSIERVGDQVRIRRKSRPAHPRYEPLGLNHTILSDPRLGGAEYGAIERCRAELSGWKTYYLDPRVAMRQARPPAEVNDIGVLGETIAPFLYRLKAEKEAHYDAVRRTLRTLIPTVEDLTVDLDKRRGTLDIVVRQDGADFSSRIVSEGTLRVLALCAIAVNPWSGSLLAFEEPENGVHPRRLELIVQLLVSLAVDHGRQLVVTTHSPVFCGAVLEHARRRPNDIKLMNVRRGLAGTEVVPFEDLGPLFSDEDISDALAMAREDGLFERLVLRGLTGE